MTQTIEQLTARVRELEEENARLKVMEESALKVCGQLDEVVIALPYDYLDPPDGGDVSLGEQVKRMYSEVKTLRHAVVATQLHAEQLREAFKTAATGYEIGSAVSTNNDHTIKLHYADQQKMEDAFDALILQLDKAISLPSDTSDTSALDAYVEQKVKEIIESHAPEGRNVTNAQHVEMRHKFVEQIATLTRQRDLAVEALRKCRYRSLVDKVVDDALEAIKESEAMAQGEKK